MLYHPSHPLTISSHPLTISFAAAIVEIGAYCIQDANVLDDVVRKLNEMQCLQPVLFKFQDKFFVKTDNTAIAVPNVSCVADAFEFLFNLFWVVNAEYPHELRLVFGLFE